MKIIDSTIFHNEYDILELRLATMYDHVDRFVIVEADHTHTGIYKGFNLEKQKERYLKYWDKINYIQLNDACRFSDSWKNENWQRDQLSLGWTDINDNDIILVSDCDEIIRPEAIEHIKNTDYGCYRLMMPVFYFKFNYLDTKLNWHYKDWGRAFRGWKSNGQDMRFRTKIPNKETIILHHAGWHFSWIGNEDFIKNKIKSFAHTEINKPHISNNINIEKFIKQGTDHFRPENNTWVPVKLDEYFPKYILENKDQFKEYIIQDTQEKTVLDYWKNKILEEER